MNVAVLGAGVIGASWTALFLAAGCRVAVYDLAEGAEDAVRAYIDTAIWAGPGLRWAAMGPTMLFHLGAGAGGLGAFCEFRSGAWATTPLR